MPVSTELRDRLPVPHRTRHEGPDYRPVRRVREARLAGHHLSLQEHGPHFTELVIQDQDFRQVAASLYYSHKTLRQEGQYEYELDITALADALRNQTDQEGWDFALAVTTPSSKTRHQYHEPITPRVRAPVPGQDPVEATVEDSFFEATVTHGLRRVLRVDVDSSTYRVLEDDCTPI